MSLLMAQNLLRQYNKKSPYKRTDAINSRADESTRRFGTWSYANKYDALYAKYSQDKNFNIDMWRDAVKLGEQDQYLAFLEQNKDTTLSNEFYDPQYYNYESMMLELYKPFADATNKEERFRDVYDYTANKWIEESMGEMSDREYIQYQIDTVKKARAAEITKQLEQERKDQMGFWNKLGHDTLATLAEFGEGVLSAIVGVIDVFGGLGYAGYKGIVENDNALDAFVDYFGEIGLTAAEKRTVRASLDEYERTHTHFRDIDGNITNAGTYFAGIANSIGMMIPAIITNVMTGGTASLAWMGTATFYASIFSNNMYENATNPYIANSPSLLKIGNAAVKTATEAIIEYGLGKALGGTIQNRLIGVGGKTAFKGLTKWSGIKYLLKSAGQEGLEEFLQDFSTNLVDQFTDLIYEGYGNNGVTFRTLIDSLFTGILSSLVMSGGQVTLNAAKSGIKNKIEPGSGDLYIETKEGRQKITGFNRLYYSSILSDFQQAVDELKKGKISALKNIGLAQEVYGGISAISQFYSSFDAKRIKNCEMLLDRVVKAETHRGAFEKFYERAADTLGVSKKWTKGIKSISQKKGKTRAQILAANMEATFVSMVYGTELRHKEKVHAAVDEVKEKLDEAGVTEMTGAVDADGIRFKKSAEMEELEAKLGKVASDRLEELRQDYDWVFTTDGHIALESKGILFVSEAWLQNYETSEIYKFLAQSKVIDTIITDEQLKPMITKLVNFDKWFTKQKNVTRERAVMDLLFNASVYQAFLLTNKGKNAHEFKDFIFRLHDLVKDLCEKSSYYNTQFKGKRSQKRVNMLKLIYEQIKNTMRKPTIKAILGWGFVPQEIGADSIFTDINGEPTPDVEFINQYKAHREIIKSAAKVGPIPSAYAHLVEDIMTHGEFDERTKEAVRKGLADDASIDERLQAIAICDYADMAMAAYDFELSREYSTVRQYYRNTNARYTALNEQYQQDLIYGEDTTSADFKALCKQTLARIEYTLDYVDDNEFQKYANALYDNVEARLNNEKSTSGDYAEIIRLSLKYFDKLLNELNTYGKLPSKVGSFIVPAQVMDLTKNDIAQAQFAADKLQEFYDTYGISALQMLHGDISTMSTAKQDKMLEDMSIFGFTDDGTFGGLFDNMREFVVKKLEQMLGDDYAVVLKNDERRTDFSIVRKIPAERFLPQTVLDLPLEYRDEVFVGIFAEDLDADDYLEALYSDNIQTRDKKLDNFINFKKLSKQMRDALKDINVRFIRGRQNLKGYWDALNNRIVINVNGDDYFATLVHEINHALQSAFGLPNGFAPETAENMPDLLDYIWDKYPVFVDYVFEQQGVGYYENGSRMRIPLEKLDPIEIKALGYCAYLLIQGELWAHSYMHNGKITKGFTINAQNTYVTAPDGTRFEIKYSENTDEQSTSISQSTTPAVVESALGVAFKKVFNAKGLIEKYGYSQSGVTRNTYHSALTKTSNIAVMQKVLNPALGVFDRVTANIDKAIKDPTTYLSDEILQLLNGDLSEGNVFYRVKEHIEKTFPGVSLDRTSNTHNYILVDDNAYDDLLLPSMVTKADSDEITLYQRLKGKNPLSSVYKSKQLAELGINPTAYIEIGPNFSTETRVDKDHRTGAIFIRADENTTDAEIIDKINHEFRHLLQYYNGFETGFTPDFKVSSEMLADVKARVPDIFADANVKKWAEYKAKLTGDTWQNEVVKHFVYFLVGGELNAYAFNASELSIKPIYVTTEAGNPTIFMPWYDAKTGEGRHKTEFIAMRADDGTYTDLPAFDPTAKGIKLSIDKKPKWSKREEIKNEEGKVVDIIYGYDKRRDWSLKDFQEGSNLKYFDKKNQRNQMDPDLQKFIDATTGHKDELPKTLWNFIGGTDAGTLTKQALFKWFRNVKVDKVNQFTFDLLNRYIFKNDHINSMQELDSLVNGKTPEFYWAAGIVLRANGLPLESFTKNISVDNFNAFLNDVAGSSWKTEIEKQWMYFTHNVKIIFDDGSSIITDITDTSAVADYMRVLTMQYFDGTLASAVYIGDVYRKCMILYEREMLEEASSSNIQLDSGKGDKSTDLESTFTNANKLQALESKGGNDILEIYDLRLGERSTIIKELVRAYRDMLIKENGLNPKKLSKKNFETLTMLIEKRENKLKKTSLPKLREMYANIINAQMTDTKIIEAQINPNIQNRKETVNRESVQRKIKNRAEKILKYVNDGEIAFKNLPPEIQDMFVLEKAKTERGKEIEIRRLNPDVYRVGRGRVKLEGLTDKKARFKYAPKHDITEGNDAFRHDTTRIQQNLYLLDTTLDKIEELIAERDNTLTKRVKMVKEKERRLDEVIRNLSAPKKDGNVRTAEFKVKSEKKKRTSDTPNYFTVVSAIDMPYVLHKIFDVSFEDMANTEVQFASRDEAGNILDKSVFKKGEFESRVKHEVNNWDAFYEATRSNLLELSRNDVLDIVEFFQHGMATLDGPANKLAAFEIFLLGYIVDGARNNFNNWNFSDQEVEMIEQLYEQKASAHGSGLNAVQQMLKVIDPLKKIRQRMLDDYNITDDELKPLFEAVDELQKASDVNARKTKAIDAAKELDKIEARMVQGDVTERGWGKRWYQKMKSFRYTAMLSSPITWIRNIISNVATMGLNKTADTLGKMIFVKKGYRKDQWNLSSVKISNNVKTFIDDMAKSMDYEYVDADGKTRKGNFFDALYDTTTTKYDDRYDRRGNRKDQKTLFINMIVNSLEQKYAAEHRWDNKTANAITIFVSKMVSDKAFIKFATNRYFGKILTLEIEKGNIDLSKGLTNDILNLFAEAVIMANTEYMHRRSFLADMTAGLRESHPVAYEVLTFWQPFLNSSFNWFQETLKYTPFGLANSIIRMCKLEQQITKIDAKRAKGELVADSRITEYLVRRDIGKGVLGLLLTGLGILLACTGRLKIEEDDDKFYMIIGDVKIDISNIFGTSSVLVGASIAQFWLKDDNGETAGFDEVMRMITTQMFEGFILNDLLARHKWDEGFWDGMLTETESILRSFMPQFIQLFVRTTNNESIKYSSGMAGMWERWLNSFLPTQPFGDRKVNPYTGEVETKYAQPFFGELLKSGILGPKIYWTEITEMERMCRELGVNKNMIDGELTINGEKHFFGDENTELLNQKYGALNKESLAKIKSQKHTVEMPDGTFKTLSWDKMSDTQRANVLNRTMVQNAQIAKIYIWTQQMGNKYYASNTMWAILKQLGITRNVYKGDKGFAE